MNRFSYIIIAISLIITASACNSKDEHQIQGEIKNYNSNMGAKEVYMYQLGAQKFITIDTAIVAENGSFSFSADGKSKGIYTIGLSPKNAITFYIDSPASNQKVTISEYEKWSKSYEIQGNDITNRIDSFVKEVNRMMTIGGDYSQRMASLSYNDTLELNKLRAEFDVEVEKFRTFRDNFIEENKKSPALIAVMDQIDPLNEMELLKETVESLGEIMPNSHYYLNLKNYIVQMEGEIVKQNLLKPGAPAPELKFPGVNGDYVALSSLKGKVVLVDFWASWCRPCRAENPNVVKLYNKYASKGFEIYSFSLDNNKDNWTNAIAQDGLIWKSHASDLKGWQTAALPIYGFNSIPFTVLIDREGNVIDKNLRGVQLENKLEQLFN